MPNYNFKCKSPKCKHSWDDILTISNREKPLSEPCPKCGKKGTILRGWDTPPTMGVDGSLKPDSAFTKRMENMRSKLGKYNPTVRNNIDRALDQRGRRYGAQ